MWPTAKVLVLLLATSYAATIKEDVTKLSTVIPATETKTETPEGRSMYGVQEVRGPYPYVPPVHPGNFNPYGPVGGYGPPGMYGPSGGFYPNHIRGPHPYYARPNYYGGGFEEYYSRNNQ